MRDSRSAGGLHAGRDRVALRSSGRHVRRHLIASLAIAAALVGVFGGPTALATPPTAVVYNAIPSPLPFNLPSQPFQAQQVSEFGDYVHLDGSNRKLRTVTVAMSDFAIQTTPANVAFCNASPSNCSPGGFNYPITLNIYGAVAGSPNTRSLPAIATVTQTFTIRWRPAEDSTCPFSSGAFGWRASDHNCYNGFLSTITFDLSSLNKTLPNDVVVGIAYNTQSAGAVPTGQDGPYNSLNVAAAGAATVGSDVSADRTFLNSANASFYGDGGAGGVGTFREDVGWGSQGTVAMEIDASPSVASDVYVNPSFTGNSGDPDGSGPVTAAGYDGFSTVQAGINAVAVGGTVHVEAGTYTENVSVNKSVTLDGNSQAATINGLVTITAPDVTVNGFSLTNPAGTSAVTALGVSNAHITNNNVHDVGGSQNASVQAIYVNRNSSADINGITITGNSVSHIHNGGTSSGKSVKAIYVGDSGGSAVIGATITGNTISDVLSSGWGAYVILVNHPNSSVDIENNMIDSVSGSFAHAIGLEADTPNAKVIGNTISNVVDSTPASPDAEAIKFESNPSANTATVTGNTWATAVPLGIVVDSASSVHGAVPAAGNWWGSFAAADVHSRTSGSVTSNPWCVDAACATLSDNTDLTSLSLSSGTLSPGFNAATTSYTANVVDTVTAVDVTATAHPGAGVVIGGGAALHTGSNTVTALVTTADGTTKTYTVTVTRAAAPLSANADLAGLSLSAGTLSPGFGAATTSYSASVDNAVTGVSVSAPAADAGASVSVNGGSNLSVGANTVTVTVTAANGTAKTYTINVVRAAAPVVGVAAVVQAVPEQSGVASVVVAATAPSAGAGTTTPPPVDVNVTWPANTFAVPVEVKLAPQAGPAPPAGGSFVPPPQPTPVAGGFSVGNTVVQLTVTDSATGAPITSFQQPITIHLSAIQAGDTPAYSHDGIAWTAIPRLSSPELPAGQQDGYFLNPDGSMDIYTLHATLFGLLTDARAPSTPALVARIAGGKLYLTLRGAKDNVRIAGYRVTQNGRLVKSTVRTYLVLPARAGTYQAFALDTAGNKSKASKTITVVRTTDKTHRLKITS